MERICVFCGASPGARPEYVHMAEELGKELAAAGIRLIYGGGSVGMMGVLAASVIENGGGVTGVTTQKLVSMEVARTDLSDLRVVETMHERKSLMADLSDGFIALPGGLGTLDEMFEALTWTQLGIHRKPCGFLNVSGYYDRLIDLIDHMITEKFVKNDCRSIIQVDENPAVLIAKLRGYKPSHGDKAAWAKSLQPVTDGRL